jgi:maltooligosyltrehalose trehalohydrolase
MLFMGEEWGAGTPWQFFSDHTDPEIAAKVRTGRRAEFAAHGWNRDDVPDPQDPATFERSKLDWSEPGQEPHARLLQWYRDLLALRRAREGLRDPHLDRVEVRYDHAAGAFWMRRGTDQVLVNLSGKEHTHNVAGPVLLSWEPGVEATNGRLVLPARSAVIVAP